MKIGVSVSIDVTKILKERLYEGKKGVYLDLTTFIDTENPDQYGNHGFISQSQTKDEREANAEKPPILGNVKVFYKDDPVQRSQEYAKGAEEARQAAQPASDFPDLDEGIPF